MNTFGTIVPHSPQDLSLLIEVGIGNDISEGEADGGEERRELTQRLRCYEVIAWRIEFVGKVKFDSEKKRGKREFAQLFAQSSSPSDLTPNPN